jgi:hypothetical protein
MPATPTRPTTAAATLRRPHRFPMPTKVTRNRMQRDRNPSICGQLRPLPIRANSTSCRTIAARAGGERDTQDDPATPACLSTDGRGVTHLPDGTVTGTPAVS